MRRIHLIDMGDGLSSILSSHFGLNVQIDWGSNTQINAVDNWKQSVKHSYYPNLFPDSFILSHFHRDHYNGLFYAARNSDELKGQFNIREFFYPGQPKFENSKLFYKALKAVSMYKIGDDSGHMGLDTVSAIQTLNRYNRKPESTELFLGDKRQIARLDFECLWPPREYNEGVLTRPVGKALKAYKDALEKNEKLRRIDNSIGEVNSFFKSETADFERFQNDPRLLNYDNELEQKFDGNQNLDEQSMKAFNKANKLLKDVANKLCLVLVQGNDLLFWGDLEQQEIKKVVNNLVEKNTTNFEVMIAPHHGTHWADDMYKLRTNYMLVPSGEERNKKFEPRLKQISQEVISTYQSGDIVKYF